MDLLRACKKQFMWFDNERTRGDVVTWYFTPPGAQFLTVPNRYTSETWDTVHWWGEGAGEAWDHVPTYYKGTPPGPFTGTDGKLCGQLEWFRDGMPQDAPPLPRRSDGLPACCLPPITMGAYSRAYSHAYDRIP